MCGVQQKTRGLRVRRPRFKFSLAAYQHQGPWNLSLVESPLFASVSPLIAFFFSFIIAYVSPCRVLFTTPANVSRASHEWNERETLGWRAGRPPGPASCKHGWKTQLDSPLFCHSLSARRVPLLWEVFAKHADSKGPSPKLPLWVLWSIQKPAIVMISELIPGLQSLPPS